MIQCEFYNDSYYHIKGETMTGIYQIADKNVQITTAYHYFHKIYDAYRVTSYSDFAITTSKAEIEAARKNVKEEAIIDGNSLRELPEPYVETLLVRNKIAEKMPKYNSVFIHGSTLAVDGKGILFIARNGIASHSYCKLWQDYFGKRAEIINHDISFIHADNRKIKVYSTPWGNVNRIEKNVSFDLHTVCILDLSKRIRVESFDTVNASTLFLQKCYRPVHRLSRQKSISVIQTVIENASLYTLHVDMNRENVKTVYDAMQWL